MKTSRSIDNFEQNLQMNLKETWVKIQSTSFKEVTKLSKSFKGVGD